ncbi:hypothetical protein GCM10027570_23260 [Streptomonospora sediminis]
MSREHGPDSAAPGAEGGGADGVDRARLDRLIGGDDLCWLVERLRSRIARGQELTGTVTLANATPQQRTAVQRLLGRRPAPGRSLTVPLGAVDAVLRRSGISPCGLRAAVEALTGPVQVRARAAAAEAREWDRAFAALEAVCSADTELTAWCERLRASGLARRLLGGPADAAPVLAVLAEVVAQLPAAGEGLAVFAARTCGDAHALDQGRPLGTLALGAVRALSGLGTGGTGSGSGSGTAACAGTGSGADTDTAGGAEARRELWAAVGLLQDELSATVLAAGLPGDGATSTGRVLAELRAAGQPAVLTLRQLVRDPPRAPGGAVQVYVCENPAVVAAAADRLGPACPPLVCTRGQPGAAVLTLLRSVAAGGAVLRYHGDFDWGGIRIANVLLRRLDWRPWRFTAADYRRAAGADGPGGTGTARGTGALTGSPVAADWDPELEPAMAGLGRRVEEEAVLGGLLADLEQAAAAAARPQAD